MGSEKVGVNAATVALRKSKRDCEPERRRRSFFDSRSQFERHDGRSIANSNFAIRPSTNDDATDVRSGNSAWPFRKFCYLRQQSDRRVRARSRVGASS